MQIKTLLQKLDERGYYIHHPQYPTPTYGWVVPVGSQVTVQNPEDLAAVISSLWKNRVLPEGMFFVAETSPKRKGEVYLNIVKHFQNLESAIWFGLSKSEVAMFELHTESTIDL